MAVLTVHGASNDFTVDAAEFLDAVRELANLGRANKGEIKGVEEKHHPLPLVRGEVDLLEGTVGHQRHLIEGGSRVVELSVSNGHVESKMR